MEQQIGMGVAEMGVRALAYRSGESPGLPIRFILVPAAAEVLAITANIKQNPKTLPPGFKTAFCA
jgi:hypothetical protein